MASSSARILPSTISTNTTTIPTTTIDSLLDRLERASSVPYSDDDPIHDAGPAVTAIIQTRPDDVLKLAHGKLHAYPYRDVPACWRRAYTDAATYKVMKILETQMIAGLKIHQCNLNDGMNIPQENGFSGSPADGIHSDHQQKDWVSEMVQLLDMALIMTGAPRREVLVATLMEELEDQLSSGGAMQLDRDRDGQHPPKRRRLSTERAASCKGQKDGDMTFEHLPSSQPLLQRPIPRRSKPPLSDFEAHVTLPHPEGPTPVIISDSLTHWPALSTPERRWDNPSYWLRKTLGGRRLVPVEIGRSYTDEGWSQNIMTFSKFMGRWMLNPDREARPTEEIAVSKRKLVAGEGSLAQPEHDIGYLAQHDLLAQIPSLRNDISIPDYCYADLPLPCTTAASPKTSGDRPQKLEEPLLNMWLGPAETISPLHTDPYHNILVQVFGYKYVRLYAPSQSSRLHPRGTSADGVDMGNTSEVDLDAYLSLFENDLQSNGTKDRFLDDGDPTAEFNTEKETFRERFPGFAEALYLEGILGPGECLYIPLGWWHYVKSLSASCSVSFWWN